MGKSKKGKSGWITLSRDILESDIWNSDEPFNQRSAWIDLIFMVNWEDKTLITRHNTIVKVARGSTFTSIPHLASRWRWSLNRVRRYLKLLSDLEMITYSGTADGTMISLVNYRKYQDAWRADGTANGTANGTADGTRLKEYKEIKERKKRASAPPSLEDKFAAIERFARKEES